MKDKKPPFHEQLANRIIRQLKDGTAPFVRPFDNSAYVRPPYNPISGTRYKGANNLWLASAPHRDPRWMTYKQAKDNGYQVRRGEKGSMIQYWKFTDTVPKRDESGKVLTGDDGRPMKVTVQLARPRVFHAVVFNATQVEGPPPLHIEYTWDPIAKAEAILQQSGVPIAHAAGAPAKYNSTLDQITLPERSQFPSAKHYYATALHELGHASGHPSRLNREGLGAPYASVAYAKEELRAEIASFMLGAELGVGHDPTNHVAYIGSWIKVLQEDPMEIMRASRDADKIASFVLGFDRTRDKAMAPSPAQPETTGPATHQKQRELER